ncbi:MAG: hypothetical protein ABIN89_25805, partial [Chitinophagaceae bacterium]
QPFAQYLAKVVNTEKFNKGVDFIVAFRDAIPANYQSQTTPFINNVVLNSIISKKTAALSGTDATNIQQQIDYLKGKIVAKKGF